MPLVDAESVAVGAPPFTPVIAKSADALDCPPTAKSTVGLSGYKRPFVRSQKEVVLPPGHAAQVGVTTPETRQSPLLFVLTPVTTPDVFAYRTLLFDVNPAPKRFSVP